MLIEGRIIITRQGEGVAWKMGRHSVEGDPNTPAVGVVDKPVEIVWSTEATGRREVSRGLIAPGGVKRVLGNR